MVPLWISDFRGEVQEFSQAAQFLDIVNIK